MVHPLCIVKRVRKSGAGRGVNGQQLFEQRLEQLEIEGVGAIGLGVGGIVVDFEEEAVDTRGDGGT